MEIGKWAFRFCYCLRNVAFPPNVLVGGEIFIRAEIQTDTDLYQLFGSNASIIWELQHRFDRLPIHRIVYYQSYHQGVLHNLIAAINMTSGQGQGQGQTLRSTLDPTGNHQDCLCMTPLHILTCSCVHNLEMYRLIIENYPANLITEDGWGCCHCCMHFEGTHLVR